MSPEGLLIPPLFNMGPVFRSPFFRMQARLLQQPGAETPEYAEQVDEVRGDGLHGYLLGKNGQRKIVARAMRQRKVVGEAGAACGFLGGAGHQVERHRDLVARVAAGALVAAATFGLRSTFMVFEN